MPPRLLWTCAEVGLPSCLVAGTSSDRGPELVVRCPACNSDDVRPSARPCEYGLLGLVPSERRMRCRQCGNEWTRASMGALAREAAQRLERRFVKAEAENARLREGLKRAAEPKRD